MLRIVMLKKEPAKKKRMPAAMYVYAVSHVSKSACKCPHGVITPKRPQPLQDRPIMLIVIMLAASDKKDRMCNLHLPAHPLELQIAEHIQYRA